MAKSKKPEGKDSPELKTIRERQKKMAEQRKEWLEKRGAQVREVTTVDLEHRLAHLKQTNERAKANLKNIENRIKETEDLIKKGVKSRPKPTQRNVLPKKTKKGKK